MKNSNYPIYQKNISKKLSNQKKGSNHLVFWFDGGNLFKRKNVVKSDEIIKSSETIYPHLLKFNSSKKKKKFKCFRWCIHYAIPEIKKGKRRCQCYECYVWEQPHASSTAVLVYVGTAHKRLSLAGNRPDRGCRRCRRRRGATRSNTRMPHPRTHTHAMPHPSTTPTYTHAHTLTLPDSWPTATPLQAVRTTLSSSWIVEKKHEGFYTGGKVSTANYDIQQNQE